MRQQGHEKWVCSNIDWSLCSSFSLFLSPTTLTPTLRHTPQHLPPTESRPPPSIISSHPCLPPLPPSTLRERRSCSAADNWKTTPPHTHPYPLSLSHIGVCSRSLLGPHFWFWHLGGRGMCKRTTNTASTRLFLTPSGPSMFVYSRVPDLHRSQAVSLLAIHSNRLSLARLAQEGVAH